MRIPTIKNIRKQDFFRGLLFFVFFLRGEGGKALNRLFLIFENY